MTPAQPSRRPTRNAASSAFCPAKSKLTLVALDDPSFQIAAQYNPKELQLTQQITWQAHNGVGSKTANKRLVEFGAMEAQTTQVELFFDGYETNGAVDGVHWPHLDRSGIPRDAGATRCTVEEAIAALRKMASIRDEHSTDEMKLRPYQILVTWGAGGFPTLRCVIESMVTKYTAFDRNGRVLRATVTLALKEADIAPPPAHSGPRRR